MLVKEDLEAAELQLQRALQCDPPFAHREKPNFTKRETRLLLAEIREQLDATRQNLKEISLTVNQ